MKKLIITTLVSMVLVGCDTNGNLISGSHYSFKRNIQTASDNGRIKLIETTRLEGKVGLIVKIDSIKRKKVKGVPRLI